MIKKVLASAAVAASVVGVSAAAAPQALAIGDDNSTTSASDSSAMQSFGNSAAYGNTSPQIALFQGSLNNPSVGLPTTANVGSVVGLVPVAVQDIPILSSPQNQ